MNLSRRGIAALAFCSGIPGLVYEVAWTREVGLLAGSQIEAVSVVVATFFGGLAFGAAVFGRFADRTENPVWLYAALEALSGVAAACSSAPLRALGSDGFALSGGVMLASCAALLFPIAVLMGGTLPALLRLAADRPEIAPGQAGRIVGANTAGAVVGVAIAVAAIPEVGLHASLVGAGSGAVSIAAIAIAFGRRRSRLPEPTTVARQRPHAGVLLAAAIVGVATLGTEVLATRLAISRLGSSLFAWGAILSLFLIGLALGNLLMAARAQRTEQPARDLGWLEVAAAVVVVLGMGWLRPDPAIPALGVDLRPLALVAVCVLPSALLMGAAFPLLVRLAVRTPDIGRSFGAVSAANTAGGIVGALALPFWLLPALGSLGAATALAGLNAAVGLLFLASGSPNRVLGLVAAAAGVCIAIWLAWIPRAPADHPWVLFVEEGRQATVVVTAAGTQRTLWVDGDPEAASSGDALRTERLLAVVPLLVHPAPLTFLEVGFGSGITYGTAVRFGLERVECVEIANAVLRAAPFFAPENGAAAGLAHQPPTHHDDARVFLAHERRQFDVISANTLHPWSVGATGLYSTEYFRRVAGALRPGGVVAQWLPTAQVGPDTIALVLATFFSVFAEGEVWLGAGNLILLGSQSPLSLPDTATMNARLERSGLRWSELGIQDVDDLLSRRIASAQSVRNVLFDLEPLTDDRPVLEHRAALGRGRARLEDVYELLGRIASDPASPRNPGARLWLESLRARANGDTERADSREALAADTGFVEALHARANRAAAAGHRALAAGDSGVAREQFRVALSLAPHSASARFGLAGIEAKHGKLTTARDAFERYVEDWPTDANAWNELASIRLRLGDTAGARSAIETALEASPFFLAAIANAGLIASDVGDTASA
ncbi:MAG: fused MFS/spermidine synthase, partial [Myxococcota bacterium]